MKAPWKRPWDKWDWLIVGSTIAWILVFLAIIQD
jgi:hypothetical protein